MNSSQFLNPVLTMGLSRGWCFGTQFFELLHEPSAYVAFGDSFFFLLHELGLDVAQGLKSSFEG